MSNKRSLAYAIILAVGLTACGGGAGGGAVNSTSSTTLTTPVSSAKASDYSGTWDGTFTITATATSSTGAVTLKLSGSDNSGTITGFIYSAGLSGSAVGTLASDGTVTLAVVNAVTGGTTWSVKLSLNSTGGVAITSITNDANTVVGTGSAVPTNPATFNMAGEYPVTITRTMPAGGAPFIAKMSLAKVADTSYEGIIWGEGGLKAHINFFRAGGYWWLSIPQGEVLGTNFYAVTNGLLTQSSPISGDLLTAAMTDNVVTNNVAPLNATMTGNYKMIYNGNEYDQMCQYKFAVELEKQ